MIITRIVGGLGNQMFQYAVAKAISVKTNVPFKLDTLSFDSYGHCTFRLDQFSIQASLVTKAELSAFLGKRNIFYPFKKRLGLTPLYKEKETGIYDPHIFTDKDIYLKGYWQTDLYFNQFRAEILQDFTPSCTFNDDTLALLDNINSQESTSVHIRRGDYINHPELGLLTEQYYLDAMDQITNIHPDTIFYVFSNDIPWCKATFRDRDNLIFVDNPESEVSDMWLMSHCKNNIIANSSFSWWGAWLNTNSAKTVICPKQWRTDMSVDKDWLPSDWIKI